MRCTDDALEAAELADAAAAEAPEVPVDRPGCSQVVLCVPTNVVEASIRPALA